MPCYIWLLNTFKDEALQKSTEQPVPVLSCHHSEKVFSGVQREPPVFNFVSIVSVLVTDHHHKSVSFLFECFLQVFICIDKTPPNLLCFMLNSQSFWAISHRRNASVLSSFYAGLSPLGPILNLSDFQYT